MSKTSTVTFITQSALEITNGQISQNSCVTNLTQTIYAGISSQVTKGCTCCSVVADTNLSPTVSNDVSYQSNATPISTSYFTADIYDSNCLNIGSTIVGVNSSEVIVGYYYPVSGLSGPVIQITGLTNESPTYFVTINSIGYSSCGEIQSQT